MKRIAYLCDGNGCDSKHKSCEYLPKGHMARCTHTSDPEHAVNGRCDDPENHTERFMYWGNGLYEEKPTV